MRVCFQGLQITLSNQSSVFSTVTLVLLPKLLVLSSPVTLTTNDSGMSFGGNKKSVKGHHKLSIEHFPALPPDAHYVHLSSGQSTWLLFTNHVSSGRLLDPSVPQKNGDDHNTP